MTKPGRTYRIRNSPEYNRALLNTGSLTIWFEDSPENGFQWNALGVKDDPKHIQMKPSCVL